MFSEQLEQIENASCQFAVSILSLSIKPTMPMLSTYSKPMLNYNSEKHSVPSKKNKEMEVFYENSSCICTILLR